MPSLIPVILPRDPAGRTMAFSDATKLFLKRCWMHYRLWRRPRHLCCYVGDHTVLTEIFFGAKIYLESRDISLSPHIMRGGSWEDELTSLLVRELQPGDGFLDIGANCGYFSLLAAKMVGPTGFVVAFEPQPKLARLITNSLSVNGFLSFSSVRAHALGEALGTGHLGHVRDYFGSASMVESFGDTDIPKTEIAIVPLDRVLAELEASHPRFRPPRMMKIDAEGFEYFIWKGMAELVKRPGRLTIIIEFGPSRYFDQGQDPRHFVDEMEGAGFRLSVMDGLGSERSFDRASIDTMIASGAFVDLILRK